MRIRLEKISELPYALCSNNIEVGFAIEGSCVEDPIVGEAFFVGYGWRTSTVTEIIDTNTFKTKNSVYRWERL